MSVKFSPRGAFGARNEEQYNAPVSSEKLPDLVQPTDEEVVSLEHARINVIDESIELIDKSEYVLAT